MAGERNRQIKAILRMSEDIFRAVPFTIPAEWLSADFTVAQLRVLLALQVNGPSRMSDIAATMDVALPTATGIVAKLVKKGLVVREADAQDRRLVICRMTPAGQGLIDKMWQLAQSRMEQLLEGLTLEELEMATGVVRAIFRNALRDGTTGRSS